MLNVMKGVGLAHTLAEAFDNSKASYGSSGCRYWSDSSINKLTTNHGKERVLGPMLDVLRGDAEIIPKKRIVMKGLIKQGDIDKYGGEEHSVIVRNRSYLRKELVLGEFTIDTISLNKNLLVQDSESKTEIDVPYIHDLSTLNKRWLIPKFLMGRKLPGIELRDFYVENPHHIPDHFHGIVLFWGTVCKNDWCYYVPGLYPDGQAYGKRICTYQVVDGKDVIRNNDYDLFDRDVIAVFV